MICWNWCGKNWVPVYESQVDYGFIRKITVVHEAINQHSFLGPRLVVSISQLVILVIVPFGAWVIPSTNGSASHSWGDGGEVRTTRVMSLSEVVLLECLVLVDVVHHDSWLWDLSEVSSVHGEFTENSVLRYIIQIHVVDHLQPLGVECIQSLHGVFALANVQGMWILDALYVGGLKLLRVMANIDPYGNHQIHQSLSGGFQVIGPF